MTEHSTREDHNIWTGFTYADAFAARQWLASLGFEEGHCYTVEGDDSVIEHSEMLWPEGGRVMVSTRTDPPSPFSAPAGAGNCYVVTSDPRAVWERGQALGATVLRELTGTDYGSLDCAFLDVEGNRWSFGTYAG